MNQSAAAPSARQPEPNPTDAPLTPIDRVPLGPERDRVERMRTISPDADPMRWVPGVPPTRVPTHVAVIMDGNGRWAESRDLPRIYGHRNGATAVRELVEWSGRLGIEQLTLFSFSSENWRRPSEEIGLLMSLYLTYLENERDELVRKNIRFSQIGRRDRLPSESLEALDALIEATASCTGPTLCLAVDYGGRHEIAHAARTLAERVAQGEIEAASIGEELFARQLDTAGMPEPDLLIRTAGEMRLSNFLLWQLSYAEIYVTETLWPDFDRDSLFDAVRAYASRERRFGRTQTQVASER
ncbi:MAG: polyprenyl diphosphate synthase [Planctomycetota bacterium]